MGEGINGDFLNRAFEDFAESSRRLERQYALLGEKLGELEREFSGKNRAAERTARLAAMGEMAAKIAHEIRNPLGSMLIFSTMLCRDLEGQPRRQELASHMVEGVRNLDRILSDMLVFSNRPEPVLERICIEEVIDKALGACSGRRGRHICVERRMQGNTMVMGDGRLLAPVFLNLFYNAFDAMGEGPGTLRVSVEKTGEGRVEAVVEDTGPGMDEEVQERIFDPFFTTRHSGTGLGLAIVATIVEAHDGLITCDSGPGRGTRFRVGIPGKEADTGRRRQGEAGQVEVPSNPFRGV